MRTLLLPAAAALLFLVLFPVIFPDAFQSTLDRWSEASTAENAGYSFGWIGRAIYPFYDFARLLGQIPLLGYGVGMAGNGAGSLGVAALAEEDWSRHVVELGPVFALLFISYRVAFGLWLGMRALKVTLKSGDSLPVLLFAYVCFPLIQGQITGHGLVNGFGWLYVGFCMAACNALDDGQSREKARIIDDASTPNRVHYPNLLP